MKRCGKCHRVKPLDEFWKMTRGTLGRQGYCKECMRGRGTVSKAHSHRRRKYGLSKEAYQEMVDRQGGRCPICRKKKKLVVHHDHRTNTVRGLLCDRCNVGMGCLGDNPVLLARAARYLLND